MTRQMKFAEAGFAVVLPGDWVTLPLDDQPMLERQISTVVMRRVGRDDRLARLRRDAKEQLRTMAASAAAAGAFRVALALEILPGVPFPAAMVFDFASWPPTAGAADADDLTERLRLSFGGFEILQLECGPTARSAEGAQLRVGSETTADVKIQYWVTSPNAEQLLHITVDAPMASDTELYTDLFDAIVDSIRWTAVAASADAPAAAPVASS
jgi:hypothetical protein